MSERTTLKELPSEVLYKALPEDRRFTFDVKHRKKHGCVVKVRLRDGVFADGESERRVYVPYRAIHTNLDAVVLMIVDGSEHALEW